MLLTPPKNITLLTSTLEGGGAARVLVNMARYWTLAGHRVTLVSFEDGSCPPFYPVHPDVRLVYLDLLRQSTGLLDSLRNNWARLSRIRREVLASRPDAAISFIDTANVRFLLAMLGTGVPIVVSERVDPSQENIGRLWNLLRRIAYPLAACVTVQTARAAAFFRGWRLRGLEVVPNPVHPPALPEPPKGKEGRVLLAVGRLYPQKGYPLLLRAFARIAPGFPAWTLRIAGHGPQQGEIEGLIRALGLETRVVLLGHVADVGSELADADAYVLSSHFEGFPNSLCEAMAAGLPCVATDCPAGPSDIVRNEENGLLVPVNDEEALAEALARLLGDESLRRALGRNAPRLLETLSETVVMNQWEACLKQAMGES